MESLQNIKRRIVSAKSINQITGAMELVAATKMRRSQEVALASRAYAFSAIDLLATLSRLTDVTLPPLFDIRAPKHTALILMTSDKGLAGAFNANVIRAFERFMAQEGMRFDDDSIAFIAVGQKAATYLERRAHRVEERFIKFGGHTAPASVRPFSEFLVQGFLDKKWDRCISFSMHFRSALVQEPIRRTLFPIDIADIERSARELIPQTGRFAELVREKHVSFFNGGGANDFLIEPNPADVIEDLAAHLIHMRMYHMILEANASEHAARRMAMKSASDSARELASDLTLEYNKARQALITRELIEITSGAESIT